MTRKYRHPQYNLRLPEDLKEYLNGQAKKNNASLNAEIIARLRETIKQDAIMDIRGRNRKEPCELDYSDMFFELVFEGKEIIEHRDTGKTLNALADFLEKEATKPKK